MGNLKRTFSGSCIEAVWRDIRRGYGRVDADVDVESSVTSLLERSTGLLRALSYFLRGLSFEREAN